MGGDERVVGSNAVGRFHLGAIEAIRMAYFRLASLRGAEIPRQLRSVSQTIHSEDDGTRTRNHRIDSPVL